MASDQPTTDPRAAGRDDQAGAVNDPERTAQPLDVAAIRRRAHADGYAEAVERLRDDERYAGWGTVSAACRRHLANYLEAQAEPDRLNPTPRQTDTRGATS